MFCRKCGKQLDDGFNVCPYCGEPVSLAESDAMRAAQEQPAEKAQSLYNNTPLPSPAPEQADVSNGASDSNENIGGWKALGFFLGFFGPALWFCRSSASCSILYGRATSPRSPRAWVSSR